MQKVKKGDYVVRKSHQGDTLFVIEKIGIERMKHLNDTNALFVELFKRAGGKNV